MSTQTDTPTHHTRLLRKPAVLDRIAVSATTLWRLERRGDFPQSIRISPGSVAWRERDVEDWIAAKAGR